MLERRISKLTQNEHFSLLTVDQVLTLYELHAFGFDLAFVRKTNQGGLAVLGLDDNLAVINQIGEVEINPVIIVR